MTKIGTDYDRKYKDEPQDLEVDRLRQDGTAVFVGLFHALDLLFYAVFELLPRISMGRFLIHRNGLLPRSIFHSRLYISSSSRCRFSLRLRRLSSSTSNCSRKEEAMRL